MASFTAVAEVGGVLLTWPHAHDDITADASIRYRIFASPDQGGENPNKPITTVTGAVTVEVTFEQLLDAFPISGADGGGATSGLVNNGENYYFVVTAVDQEGDSSAPLHEVHVGPMASFEGDVQPIFTKSCAIATCHTSAGGASPSIGLNLDEGASYVGLYDVVATEASHFPPEAGDALLKRIDGGSKTLSDSYLWRKIKAGTDGEIFAQQMPPTSKPQLTSPRDFNVISTWITQGARRN
ncbi:MAG TPA: hypothetical protein VH142_03140 [Polyangiaceae bacterium]|nr:hypothetical protein [Polyangiaceae bacterium]